MITVQKPQKPEPQFTTLGELLKLRPADAFIGGCGVGPEHSVYILGTDQIFLAREPKRSWGSSTCPVTVERFVDLIITVVNKGD